jgi:hypothetical protein
MAAYLPPGWPPGVHPPGSEDFERTAQAWLLDVVPPDYRLHGVLRRYPLALAAMAVHHTQACVTGARDGYRTARTELGAALPAHALEAVLAAYRAEGRRLVATARAVDLVARALRGEVFTPRLEDGRAGPPGRDGAAAGRPAPAPDRGAAGRAAPGGPGNGGPVPSGPAPASRAPANGVRGNGARENGASGATTPGHTTPGHTATGGAPEDAAPGGAVARDGAPSNGERASGAGRNEAPVNAPRPGAPDNAARNAVPGSTPRSGVPASAPRNGGPKNKAPAAPRKKAGTRRTTTRADHPAAP